MKSVKIIFTESTSRSIRYDFEEQGYYLYLPYELSPYEEFIRRNIERRCHFKSVDNTMMDIDEICRVIPANCMQ